MNNKLNLDGTKINNERFKLTAPVSEVTLYNGTPPFNFEITIEDGKLIIINSVESNLTIDDIEIRTL